jgi:hypothetical protein
MIANIYARKLHRPTARAATAVDAAAATFATLLQLQGRTIRSVTCVLNLMVATAATTKRTGDHRCVTAPSTGSLQLTHTLAGRVLMLPPPSGPFHIRSNGPRPLVLAHAGEK